MFETIEAHQSSRWTRDDYKAVEVWDSFPKGHLEGDDEFPCIEDGLDPEADEWVPSALKGLSLEGTPGKGPCGDDRDADKENRPPNCDVSPSSVLDFSDAGRDGRRDRRQDQGATFYPLEAHSEAVLPVVDASSPTSRSHTSAELSPETPWSNVVKGLLPFPLDDHADPAEYRGSCSICGDPVYRSQPRVRDGRAIKHVACPLRHASRGAKKLSFAEITNDRKGAGLLDDWDVPSPEQLLGATTVLAASETL